MVGLGRVKGSQKTTPLEPRLASFSAFAKIEVWDTPVECDFEISEAAEGVAVCNTGLLMTGREGTLGNVDDFGNDKGLAAFSLEEAAMGGSVLVLDKNGIVTEEELGGGDSTGIVAASFFLTSSSLVSEVGFAGSGGGVFFVATFSFLLFVESAVVATLVARPLCALWLVPTEATAAFEVAVKAVRPAKEEL